MAEWKPSDTGRDAKFYRLTPKGRAQLQEQTESWSPAGRGGGSDSRDGGRKRAVNWWGRLRNRGRAEDELDRELRDHVERQVADHIGGRDVAAGGAPARAPRVRMRRSGYRGSIRGTR